jgi:hypothetical protein
MVLLTEMAQKGRPEMGESRMLKILSIGAALSFLLVSSAVAEPRLPCAAEIKTVCAKVDPGEGRLAACIKENLKDLPACKGRMSKLAAANKVCREDVQKQCGSVRGRVQKVKCVADALTDLGDACKTAIAAVVSRKK